MNFEPNAYYHIYNRSNETLFYTRDNYLFFLRKIENHVKPVCNILAWVLMPNHFHFMIQATPESCTKINENHRLNVQQLSKRIGNVLSAYTQGINRQQNRRGKLFAHNTKAKDLNEIAINEVLNSSNSLTNKLDYATTCFLYIHQNPLMAGLVKSLAEWEFSSFRDYAGIREGKLIAREIAKEVIQIDFDNFKQQSQCLADEAILRKLY